MTLKIDLDNYIAGGGLEADLDRWFADESRADCDPPLDTKPFLERLAPEARPALEALDALIRNGRFPSMSGFGIAKDWTYGVDLEANEQEAEFEGTDVIKDIFPLAADGGGNLFVQLLDGRVGIWSHEEALVEDHTLFASLDECLWVLVRIESVQEDDGIDAAELTSALANADDDTGPGYYRDWLEEFLEDQ